MKLNLNSRFQDQPWHIKLWRYRWYLLIPYDTMYSWLYNNFRPQKRSHETKMDLGLFWDIAISSAQIKMNWFYNLEDPSKINKDKGFE